MTLNNESLEPQSSKPAWFQLVDSDAPSAQVSKVDKKLPVIALIVTGVIAASGTLFSSTSGKNQFTESAIPSVSTTASKSPEVINFNSSTASPATVQNPSEGGIAAPSGGYDDEDEDEDEEDNDEDEDEEERN